MLFKTDIQVGDEIKFSEQDVPLGVVTRIVETAIGQMIWYIGKDGFGDCVDCRLREDIEKTGRKVDVKKFLREVGGNL